MNALVDTRIDPADSLGIELAWLKSRLRGEDAYPWMADGRSPLDDLALRLGLSMFARHVLLLAAAPDLDDEAAALIAERSPDQPWPSLVLASALFGRNDFAALAPDAPLRALDLVRLSGDGVLSQKAIYADERVVFALRGIDTLDAWLSAWLTPLTSHAGTGSLDAKLTHTLARLLADDADPLAILTGGSMAERHAHVLAAAALTGAAALRMTVPDATQADPEPNEFIRRWRREAALSPRILMLEATEWPARWLRAIEQITTCVVAADASPDIPGTRQQTILHLPASDLNSRRARWRAHLPTLPEAAIMRLAAEYRHAPERLHLTVASERDAADACRALTRGNLAGLAEHIDANVDWNELVLPDEQANQLRELAAHAGSRVLVGESWGFARRNGRGNGVAALFSGPPGTGKTLAARVIAHAIGHDLYRVDLSRVVSKYVGETEKNLARVFDAADCGGAVLLFDEADALFGRRTEGKDSRDRHANLETAYLLQRMESFNGLAILTTNLDQLLDAAFLRRLAFVVRFPFPGETARRDIWRHAFPAQTPLADIDPDQLARMPLAGGHIANIAWSAACRAANAGCEVQTVHIVAAARAECMKLERPWQESWLHGGDR
ncbi:SpoVK/Ycf46/Vps4 family AAA+-type ATPase [Luteibacter rhizovicinus]|uniref:SpoVK/Ycf46/Vps4 family AAA+-type ATPase n=1 Tax=Luteibacter rhizovicinus TaxID=242606 RepID=A0A4R3YQL7_9GAMM|nr:ATP-binding protein [Luteibacter rhizovicinus]TCV94656.1 SpoVK/Ycf46/Vps4 family AAA+-type ATPase [Luteibacter rhizovicinus]